MRSPIRRNSKRNLLEHEYVRLVTWLLLGCVLVLAFGICLISMEQCTVCH